MFITKKKQWRVRRMITIMTKMMRMMMIAMIMITIMMIKMRMVREQVLRGRTRSLPASSSGEQKRGTRDGFVLSSSLCSHYIIGA